MIFILHYCFLEHERQTTNYNQVNHSNSRYYQIKMLQCNISSFFIFNDLNFLPLYLYLSMFCCNEEIANEKANKKDTKKIQNAIATKPQRQRPKNAAEQIEELKLMQSKQLEAFKQFKRNFKKDALENKENVEQLLQSIRKAKSVKQIEKINLPEGSYWSISQYFSNSCFSQKYTTDWFPFVEGNISSIYKDYVMSKKKERELVICLNHSLQLIINYFSKQSVPQHQSLMIESVRQLESGVHEKLEELLTKARMLHLQETELTRQINVFDQHHAQANRMFDSRLTEKQFRDKLSKIQEEKQEIRNINFQLTIQLQSAKDKLREQIEKGKQRLKEQKQFAKERLKEQMQNAREQKEQLKKELEESKGRLKLELEESKHRFISQLQQTKERLKLELETTKEKLTNEVENIKEQKMALKVQMQQLKKKLQTQETKAQMLRQQFEEKLQKVVYQKNNLRVQAQNTKQLLKMELQMIKAQKQILQKEKIDLCGLKESLENEIYSFNSVIASLQEQIQFLKNVPSPKKMLSQSDVAIKTLFTGQILAKKGPYKKFLIDSIVCHMDKQIVMSEKLYDFKRDQQADVHKFIDGHSNLVLIVQTQSAVIACYYSGLYNKELLMQDQALIMSLDNQKAYKLNNFKNYPSKDPKDKRSIQGMMYNDQSLIFGNSQVRIKIGQNVIFSNFGTSNCYFNSQNYKVGDLLNEGDINEVQLINYEIHEAFLNEKSFSVNLQELQASP